MRIQVDAIRRLIVLAAVAFAPVLLGNEACNASHGTTPSVGVGALCGGVAGTACIDGTFCDYAAVDPATGDRSGRCAEQPSGTSCNLVLAPVCGMDGQSYANACFASASGVSVVHDGACAASTCTGPSPLAPNVLCSDGSIGGPVCICDVAGCGWQIRSCPVAPRSCGGRSGIACAVGEFCDLDPSAACGVADLGGICRAIPQLCTTDYAPVCGCDGKTYGNACAAAREGVSVDHTGACVSPGPCTPAECGPGPASPLPYDCVLDASGACSWQLACVPPPCAAPPIGCAYVGGDVCHCGTLTCAPGTGP